MSKDSLNAGLRVLFASGSPLAVLIITQLGITQNDYVIYYNAAMALVPTIAFAAYEYWHNRKDNVLKRVDKLDEVSAIVVKNNANGKVGALADDINVAPKVIREKEILKKDG